MFIQTLRMAIILAALVIVAPASAQSYLFNQHTSAGIERGSLTLPPANCGRGITQQQAEGLWGGYCTESCAYQHQGNPGGGCSLCGAKGGCGCGSGGCNNGSFGYPTGGGGGCGGGSCLGGKGHGCKLRGLHGGGHFGNGLFGAGAAGGCGSGSCGGKGCGCKLHQLIHGGGHFGAGAAGGYGSGSCGGKGCGCKLHQLIHGGGGGFGAGSGDSCDSGSCGGGGHCGSCKLKSLMSGCKLFGGGCCKFKHSAQACGTNGAYFDEAVGYEYGTGGMQSCVSCGGMGANQMYAPEMMVPSAPVRNGIDATQPVQPMQHAPMMQQGAPLMMEPVVGSIESMNGVFPGN